MKNSLNIKTLLLLSLLVMSCQAEKYEVLTEEDQKSFMEGSELNDLVMRSAMHDGSQDDELDESPCFSINFPYKVIIQGVEIKVGSSSDLDVILEKIGSAAKQDFAFRFPISITWSDYENVSVSNLQELAALKGACAKDIAAGRFPISCAEIEFPVKLYAYNVNTQNTSSINAANKKQLYVFLQNSSSNQVLSFDYPISLSFEGSAGIEVNNNNEFATALKTCLN